MKCLAYVARRHRHRSKRDRPPKVQLFRRRRETPVRSTTSEAGPLVTTGEKPDANIASTALTDPPPPLSSGCLRRPRSGTGRAGRPPRPGWASAVGVVVDVDELRRPGRVRRLRAHVGRPRRAPARPVAPPGGTGSLRGCRSNRTPRRVPRLEASRVAEPHPHSQQQRQRRHGMVWRDQRPDSPVIGGERRPDPPG